MKKKKYCFVIYRDKKGKVGVKKITVDKANEIGMIRYETEQEAYENLNKIKK